MSLKDISSEELIHRLKDLKSREDALLVELLDHIAEVERRKLFLKLGFPSLFLYLHKELGYGEGEAYRRIQSARLLIELPEIRDSVANGQLSLSNMNEVQRALRANPKPATRSAKLELLNSVRGCSRREAQSVLVKSLPEIRGVFEDKFFERADGSVEMTVCLQTPQKIRFERARDILGHRAKKGGEAIDLLSQHFLKTKDLTQGFAAGGEALRQPEPNANPVLRRISMSLRRAVFRRDRGRCQFKKPDGQICGTAFAVEIDHIIPWSRGGKNTYDNLRCLCRAHNQYKGDRPDAR
ncbi:MAG TPA: HNH endonuclease [Bdellovibrionales bacterium]|nr:HNH endonuclease [Bdellovibrionales bacterium]